LDKGHALVNFFTFKQHFCLAIFKKKILQKIFVKKNAPNSPDFEELFSEIGIFRQCVSVGCQKYSRILFLKLLSTQSCSQIWLIPIVNDHQCKTSQNWGEKKKPLL